MKYSVKHDNPEHAVLTIEGELDAVTAPELRPALDKLVNSSVNAVTANLSRLRLIDSSGVGALVSLYKRLKADGREMTVVGLSEQPLAIFKLLKLDTVLAA